MQSPVDEEFHLCNVAYWPITSVRCAATIRPESGVKRTWQEHCATGVIDPARTSRRHTPPYGIGTGLVGDMTSRIRRNTLAHTRS